MRAFDAVDVPLDGRSLVEASAGTGKTYAITTLVTRLVVEAGLRIDQILVVTFTEAATAELRDRTRRRLRDALALFEADGEAGADADPALLALWQASDDRARDRRRLEAALRSVDLAAISTIHGFCHRVLHDSAFDSGALFEQELVADVERLHGQVVGDFWVEQMHRGSATLAQALRRSRVGPARLRGLVRRIDQRPDLPLVPEAAEADEAWREQFAAAVRGARAAWEREAVQALLGSGVLYKSRYPLEKVPGWCLRMEAFLDEPPESPHLDDPLGAFRASRIKASTYKGKTTPSHPFFGACEELAAAASAFAGYGARVALAFQHRLAEYARRELPRRKEEAGTLSFDDLLLGLRAALRGGSGDALARGLARRYPAALIDEFQDTDPVQYEIFERIYRAEDTRLFLVGDPKQAIYSFRGADVFAYLQAAADTAEARRYTMAHNWRSGPSLVEAVNAVFGRAKRPFLFADIEYPEVAARPGAADVLAHADGSPAPPLEVLFVPRTDEERGKRGWDGNRVDKAWWERGVPELVAADIERLLGGASTIGGEEVSAGSVAVLTRTNQEAFLVQDALRARRIPSVVLGDKSVFDSQEAEELLRVLVAIADPTQGAALRAALVTDLLGVTANELADMEREDEAWGLWVHDFRELNAQWVQRGFVQMFRALLARRGVQRRLLGLTDGERRMTNLLHLAELLHTAAKGQHLGPTGLLHWLRRQRGVAGYAAEANQIRLESDERAVRITTVHRAKGLEYDVVYCPYLWNGWLLHPEERAALAFHDPERDGELVLDIDPARDSDGAAAMLTDREKLAESLRLLYVALTRAKQRCTVVWGALGSYGTSALAYLLHADEPGVDPDLPVKALRGYLTKLDDAAMRGALERLEASAGGRVAVRDVTRDAPASAAGEAPPRAEETESTRLAARAFRRAVDRDWRIASFSQLAGSAAVRDDEARERDEAPLEEDEAVPFVEPEAVPASAASALSGFPRGARVGNLYHDLLEHLDFTAGDAERDAAVADALRRHGFDRDTWAAQLRRSLDDVLDASIELHGEADLALAALPAAHRLNEMEFHLPVAGRDRPRLLPERLAAVFEDHPSDDLPAEYAAHLRRMRFPALWGFLRGFIDLVFEHDGRFYVVDYKTTYLGDAIDDYRAERLAPAMVAGDYLLQSHLYAVAVHRHLRRRLRGYDYERHFGGMRYLFVRGMCPGASGRGVFVENPPQARIEALDRLLAGETEA